VLAATTPLAVSARDELLFEFFEKKTAEGDWVTDSGLLPAEPQPFDQAFVSAEVAPPQIVEQTATLADELEQPPAGMVIFDVSLEVLGEMADPCTQQRHLNFRRTRIGRVKLVLTNDVLGAPLRRFHSSSVFSS
jgi:hypothetical protein